MSAVSCSENPLLISNIVVFSIHNQKSSNKKMFPYVYHPTGNQKLETDLKDLAQDIVRRAMSGGATAAECMIREGDEFSTVVRLGQVETLKESGSKAVG